jgi:hypothetical protein
MVVQGVAALEVAQDKYLRRVMVTDIFGGLFEAFACQACRRQLRLEVDADLARAMDRRVRVFRVALMMRAYTPGVICVRRLVFREVLPHYLGARARAHGCFPSLLYMTCGLITRLSDVHIILMKQQADAGVGAEAEAAVQPALPLSIQTELQRAYSVFVEDMAAALIPTLTALRAADEDRARACLLGMATRVVFNMHAGAQVLAVAHGQRPGALAVLQPHQVTAVRFFCRFKAKVVAKLL